MKVESSRQSSHINEGVDVVVIPPHVLLFDQPLQLLLDHLLRGQKHVLKNIDQLGLFAGLNGRKCKKIKNGKWKMEL